MDAKISLCSRGRPRKPNLSLQEESSQLQKISAFFTLTRENDHRDKRSRSDAFEESPESPGSGLPIKKTSVSPTHLLNIRQEELKSILEELRQMRRENNEARVETNNKLAELAEKIKEESTSNCNRLAEIKNEIQKRDELWSAKFEKLCCRVSDIEKNLAQFSNIRETVKNEIAQLETHSPPVVSLALENQIRGCSDWMEGWERKERKLNIVIKGLNANTDNLLAEINLFFSNTFGLKDCITRHKILNANKKIILATVADWDLKLNIMKNKSTKLGGMGIYIENDLTPQERAIDYKLRMTAKKELSLGKKVRLSYQKIRINGIWYPWDKKANDISNTPLPVENLPNSRTSYAVAAPSKNL